MAAEASGSCERSVVLIMWCAATLRSCDIYYQPSGRETRHFFFCRSNPSSHPSPLPHTAVCVRCPGALLYLSVCEKCVRVNANPHVESNKRASNSHRVCVKVQLIHPGC